MEDAFFKKPTIEVAKNLLGSNLVFESGEGRCVGKIVETEAYLEDDPASHSFVGKTERNKVMFEEGGRAYVYFTYGMYFCFNIVTGGEGKGEAVLIRAVEPIEGIELMKKRRNKEKIKELCNGPAKLTQAFGIGREHNGLKIGKELRIEFPKRKENFDIVESERIGISKGKDLRYRFFIKGNEFVSKK